MVESTGPDWPDAGGRLPPLKTRPGPHALIGQTRREWLAAPPATLWQVHCGWCFAFRNNISQTPIEHHRIPQFINSRAHPSRTLKPCEALLRPHHHHGRRKDSVSYPTRLVQIDPLTCHRELMAKSRDQLTYVSTLFPSTTAILTQPQ